MTKFALALTSFSILSAAARADMDTPSALTAGHSKVGGGLTWSKNGTSRGATSFSADATYDYFLVDHFALGGVLSLAKESGSDFAGVLGPQAVWYFWSQERSALDLTGATLFGLSSESTKAVINVSVGYDAFLNESIALRPYFMLSRRMPRGTGGNYTRYILGVSFGLYL